MKKIVPSEKNCLVCNGPMKRKKGESRTDWNDRKFCSIKCGLQAITVFNYKCRFCGAVSEKRIKIGEACDTCNTKREKTCLCSSCDGVGCRCAECWAVCFCKSAFKESCSKKFIYNDHLLRKMLSSSIIEKRKYLLPRRGQLYNEKKSIENYFFKKINDNNPLSFDNTCKLLGINPGRARKALMETAHGNKVANI